MTERAIHIAVVAFLRVAMPEEVVFYHAANGEHRDVRTAQKLKAFGVLPGVPDLCLVLPTGIAAFIEIKAPKGYLSPAQKAFRDRVTEAGAYHAECRSVAEAEEIVSGWLAPFGLALKARLAA